MIKMFTLAALLAGCAAAAEPEAVGQTQALAAPGLVFTYEGSAEALPYAQAAAAEWRDVCGSDVVVTDAPGGIPFRQVELSDPALGGDRQAVTFGTSKRIKGIDFAIVAFQEPADRAAWTTMVMAHELGHALNGPAHSTDVADVMYPGQPAVAHVRPEDCR